MIESKILFEEFKKLKVNFFTGVPDSLLKDFCGYISDNTTSMEHIITANEGAAVALATGYHLATGNIPMVYMQNSGLGNAINPLLSLADKEVYSIPMILMIGWRGEPGVKDEPQHIKQGRVQNNMLDSMEIPYRILDSSVEDITSFIDEIIGLVNKAQSPVAIVVRKNSFNTYKIKDDKSQKFTLSREMAIGKVIDNIPEGALIVSTTGKTSREVFEYREERKQNHQNDFLTVGSMGHCSQIAMGIALNTRKKVICLDGDGAVIMHMGSMSIIGQNAPSNYIHIILNNGAHDSVGGQSTIGLDINITEIALSCGYRQVASISEIDDLEKNISSLIEETGPVFIEIKVKKGARSDLGRPTSLPIENRNAFVNYIRKDY